MRVLAALLALLLASPAPAEVRPLPRPAAILAFAGATGLAPRATLRPLRSPDIVAAPTPLVPAMVPSHLARRLATEPAFARAPAGALRVTLSTSTAPRMPDAAAAVRAAFTSTAGPVLRPRLRPEVQPAALVIGPRLRPAPRPALAPEMAAQPMPAILRPMKRPAGLSLPAADPEAQIVRTAAIRVNPGEQLVKPKRGSVCGVRGIRGEALAPIPARIKGCGLAEPVRVTEVDGVRLSPAATIDCPTAKALSSWVSDALKPAVGRRDVAQLNVAAGYACRTRNNVRGARISEHGRGRAIDITAVVLGNGQVIDVLRSYRGEAGKFLRVAYKKACGIFGTTLGPGSDGYHENNLHFDTARYRSGAFCR